MSKLTLVVTIHDALNDPDVPDVAQFKSRILQVTVHSWYEGHIEGEAKAGRVQTLPTAQTSEPSEMPSPPFPSPNSEEAAAILRETFDRFSEDELTSAVAFAAGLAWAAGYREGRECSGGTSRATSDTRLAAHLRADQAAVRLEGGRLAELLD